MLAHHLRRWVNIKLSLVQRLRGGSPEYIVSLRVSDEEMSVSLEPESQSVGRTSDFRHSRQAALTTVPGPQPAGRVNT